MDPDGQVLAVVAGLRIERASRQAILGRASATADEWLYTVQWRPQVRRHEPAPGEFLANTSAICDELRRQLPGWSKDAKLDRYLGTLAGMESLSTSTSSPRCGNLAATSRRARVSPQRRWPSCAASPIRTGVSSTGCWRSWKKNSCFAAATSAGKCCDSLMSLARRTLWRRACGERPRGRGRADPAPSLWWCAGRSATGKVRPTRLAVPGRRRRGAGSALSGIPRARRS